MASNLMAMASLDTAHAFSAFAGVPEPGSDGCRACGGGAVTARTPRRKVPTCGLCEARRVLEKLCLVGFRILKQNISRGGHTPYLCVPRDSSTWDK